MYNEMMELLNSYTFRSLAIWAVSLTICFVWHVATTRDSEE